MDGLATVTVAPVELTTLEVGPYPAEPATYEPEIDDKEQVFEIESRRMLGYLVPSNEKYPPQRQLDIPVTPTAVPS